MTVELLTQLSRGLPVAALALIAAQAVGVPAATAQYRDRYEQRYSPAEMDDFSDRPPVRSREKRRAAPAEDEAVEGSMTGPAMLAVVSIRDQRIALYDANGGSVRARISSGQTGYETPVGTFSILQKKEEHYSNLYDDASMPFMQRLTWTGIALHAGALPGHPASHGCVRLPHSFAEDIFGRTKLGLRVVISAGDVAPVDISHPLLPQPKPIAESTAAAAATPAAYHGGDDDAGNAGDWLYPRVSQWPARQKLLDSLRATADAKHAEAEPTAAPAEEAKAELKKKTSAHAKIAKAYKAAQASKKKADERVAWAEKAVATAKTGKQSKNAEEAKAKALAALPPVEAKLATAKSAMDAADAELAEATQKAKDTEKARAEAVEVAKAAQRKAMPVSIFVSLKSKRLYVRQGYEPVFDVPVEIRDPETPIGTHVYTALDFANGGNELKWNVVSVRHRGQEDEQYAELDLDRSSRNDAGEGARPTDVVKAKAALDRLVIPADVIARVSDSAWPGSSLIISDEDLSKETGKFTDFVVVMSSEPQGALKKRKRQPPPDMYYYSYGPFGTWESYDDDRRRPQRYRPKKSLFGWW